MLPRSLTLILLSTLATALTNMPGRANDQWQSSYNQAGPNYQQGHRSNYLSDSSPTSSTEVMTGDVITTDVGSSGPSSPPPSSPASMPGGDAPPGTFLQGGVTVLGPGTHFRVQLNNTLDSTYSNAGEEFQATVTEPVILNGQVAIPPGSKLTGQVTKVVSPKNFKFGVNGRIDVKFVAVETPDGRKFPINASIDVKQLQAASGHKNPGGRAMTSMKRGAVTGAKWGGGMGGLYGVATSTSAFYGGNSAFSRGLRMGAMGALAGGVVGAGGGLVASGVKKGGEVHVPVGTNLPVQLDEPLAMGNPQYFQKPAHQFYDDYPQASQQQPQQQPQHPWGNFTPPATNSKSSQQPFGNSPPPGTYSQSSQQPSSTYP